MFKKFKDDMQKYWKYAIYSSKANLKSEVANSYLNWLWWILDPLCFMLIYAFMFGYVFNASEDYFVIFIFIGITMWDFFNRTLTQSVKLVKANKAIVSKVYLPKYILILIKMGVNGFKMLVSLGIIVIMLAAFRVPLSINILFAVPILLTLLVLSFGIACFLMHYGVFVEDLSNVLRIVLRFLFYLTGIFWNIESRLPAPIGEYANRYNPVAFLLTSMRKCLLYQETPNWQWLLVWFFIALLISALGICKIYKNENSYVKVI